MARVNMDTGGQFKQVMLREKYDAMLKEGDLNELEERLFGNPDYISHIHGIIENLEFAKPYKTADLLNRYGVKETKDGKHKKVDAEITPDPVYIGKGPMTLDDAVATFEGHEVYSVVHEKVHDIFPLIEDENMIEHLTGELLRYFSIYSPEEKVRDLSYRGYLDWEENYHNLYNDGLDGRCLTRFQQSAAQGGSAGNEVITIAGDTLNLGEGLIKWIWGNTVGSVMKTYADVDANLPEGSLSRYIAGKANRFYDIYRQNKEQPQAEEGND